MLSGYIRKVDEFFTVEGLKDNWALLGLAAVFMLAVYLRYLPEQGMAYLQALDPYMIFRMSQHLALEGSLPSIDFMRYFPYSQPTYLLNQGDILFPAVLYWLGPFLFFGSFLEWVQFYPALMGGVGVVFAYFLGKELWGKVAGLSSAFFLATIAGVMHRTSAGFFEKEPVGTAFMMISLYTFTRAWKRKEWIAGIFSGLALGFFTISWGGSKMMWLLYPLTVGVVMFLDEDIEELVTAYTPTVIIGAGVAIALNPSRFWYTSSLFLANAGILVFLWSRYLVERLDLIEEAYLKFYVPVLSVLGGIAALLSPLYWDFLGAKVLSLISMATQTASKTDIVAGTVAENTPATLGQIVSQLGAIYATYVNSFLGLFANVVGPWPLAFIGVAFMGTSLLAMILHKYSVLEDTIEGSSYYYMFFATFLAWLLTFAVFFRASVLTAVLPSTVMVIGGAIIVYALDGIEEFEIEFKWYYFLPFFWTVSNILGAVTKSRLVFLAGFPVAFTAGYTLSLAINRIRSLDHEELLGDLGPEALTVTVAILVATVFAVNTASGYASASTISGSPNQAWMQNLDYMRKNTEPGSVILSWWDYGYWFESIGRRAAIADGGNAGYYSSGKYSKINYPLANYLTSSNPNNWTWFLEKHSVDYIVLDQTMIGKYSAVSQISNRDNSQFTSMLQFQTPGAARNSLSRSGNTTVLQMQGSSAGTSYMKLYVPVNRSGSDVKISGPPTLSAGARGKIGCVLTDNGMKTFDVDPLELQGTGEMCVAENPYTSLKRGLASNTRAGAVLVPKKIADSTLVRLYLMNGHGIDYVTPVKGGSNGYVKMWKVDTG